MRFPDRVRRVVIVGAGLGGVATAVRLLQFAREPLQVVLAEQRPEHRNAGVAYHRAGNPWHHVFNIQAGRMAMFREDVDDFVAWANDEADRTGWPREWRDFVFTESGPAPRRIYADYLTERLADAARQAADGVTLAEVDGEVVDLAVDDGRVRVVIENSADAGTLVADHVVIATGLQERELPFAAEVAGHPLFVRHPYSQSGVERILAVSPDAEVAIIGTLLSAYDSAALLLRRGHTGTIHMISRSGITLRTYPTDHQHRVLDLPAPQLHNEGYEGRDNLVRRLKDEWERICGVVETEHPDVAKAVVTERVSKSWEPYLPEVLARVPAPDLRALLDSYSSLLATLRVSAVAYTTEIVDAAMADGGRISLVTGKVDRITAAGPGKLAVSVAGRTIEADLVIANFGREPDYERVRSKLWQNLLRGGIAVPHHRTGRGVEVDALGTLLGQAGSRSGPISVVGAPREGDEIVRYGRMGAFSFNLAAIKNHSVGVAAAVLNRLESCYDEQADELADTLAGSSDSEVREAFAYSVALDVHRMAARRLTTREVLAARLDKSLLVLHEAVGSTDAALRYAVNTAAVVKLNDLSVTPRDLRCVLGLDEPVG
ncbi:FAD/NAD(P)-binding protein [Kibdelosporangium phytohabitans]|uniref:Pyridine nucleotide-disulfide oxidoreductase n=1 Tax=Kibdelosporangium phytohabitans TaxID=860235 RepID=A0A0N9HYW5_9PSEU|nr:FAD/NAD(P)-binding protein [Kibdelosporangium phytohabitans]ALG08494.1 pyridine nucleotide-disulfide oxidoreductase [Kibdelosporangium phytohabitans]MBE1470440.1 putative NAD(P)/FAD-binding protein YdhS [Kibdelosporangium phytohabitans]